MSLVPFISLYSTVYFTKRRFIRDNSKLRTYGIIKRTLGNETYLLSNIKLDQRISRTKLRLSNHELMIEKGRHLKIGKTRRFCPFYPTNIESEKHVMLQCKAYTPIRDILVHTVCDIHPQFTFFCNDEKFVSLLSKDMFTHEVAPYIHKLFKSEHFTSTATKQLINITKLPYHTIEDLVKI